MRTRRYAVPAALAAFALVLTGCSGGEEELKAEESPLTEYFGALSGVGLSPEDQQRKAEEEEAKRENAIAECMTDAGFEYIPNTGNVTVASGNDDIVYEPDSKEWVTQWGYGAVNSPYNEIASTFDETEYQDPNQEYVESLSESEQTAYYETLNGAGSVVEEGSSESTEGSSEGNPLEDMGCFGAAYMQSSATSVLYSGEFDDLIEKMSTMSADAQNDPALSALDKEWASCMADAGQPGFKAQGDAAQSIYDKSNAIYEENPEGIEQDAPEFKELAEEEIALALIDLDCREKTNYKEEQLKIQFALEEQFIEQNKPELEKLKAALEQGE